MSCFCVVVFLLGVFFFFFFQMTILWSITGLFFFFFFLSDVHKVEHMPGASLRALQRVKELTDVYYGLNTALYISVMFIFPCKNITVFTYVESVIH